VSNGKITVRRGPTYEQDLRRLNLKPGDLKAVTDAIDDILKALSESPNNPDKTGAGNPFPQDSHRSWKRRVSLPGSNRGKRGALRLVYWWRRAEREMVLFYLYYKPDKKDLAQKEIDKARERFMDASST